MHIKQGYRYEDFVIEELSKDGMISPMEAAFLHSWVHRSQP